MKNYIRNKLNGFWGRKHRTVYEEGGCSTCGPFQIDVIEEEDFKQMLNEIDKWIDEVFDDKS